MLETIREYALAQLNECRDADTIRWRHAQYYLKLAGAAEPELTGTRQIAWLDRLEREHGNLRAALDLALDCGQVTLAAQLCGTLWHFWAMRAVTWTRGGAGWSARVGSERKARLACNPRCVPCCGTARVAWRTTRAITRRRGCSLRKGWTWPAKRATVEHGLCARRPGRAGDKPGRL